MDKNDPRRRPILGLFNDKQKQITYALSNVFVTLFVVLIINTISLVKFSQIEDLCKGSGGVFNSNAVSEHLGFMIIGSLGAILIAGFVCFAFVIVLTHRFFGPMVAVHRHLNELERGNYSSRIQLRKNDELKDLADHLNNLAATLEKKV